MENTIEFKCPDCNHKVIADIDLKNMVKIEMQKLIDKIQEEIKT